MLPLNKKCLNWKKKIEHIKVFNLLEKKHWVKVNADGSYLSEKLSAACGGILRIHDDKFVGAWCANLGYVSTTLAELQGVYWGLFVGIKLGFNNI